MDDARGAHGPDSVDDDRSVADLQQEVDALKAGLVVVAGDATKSNRRGVINRSLIVVLVLAAFAGAVVIQEQNDTIDEGRRAGSLFSCRGNQAQDDVLRSMLEPSVESDDPVSREEANQLRHTYERVMERTPGNKPLKQLRLELVERLMEPLGGYRATSAEKKALCAAQLRRSNLKP